MRNLINFLIKYNNWFVFVVLELFCFFIMFRFNSYQGSVYFTSVNTIASSVYSITSSIYSYFGLRTANEQLLETNFRLQCENAYLKVLLSEKENDSTNCIPIQYETINAFVLNNSINKNDNYITIDKGSVDGVKSDMGVIGPGGIVGIVYLVSKNFSLVISALNSKSTISCKVKGSDYFGNLRWDGDNSSVAVLYDLPNHADVSIGDTIITSGYSSVFPEGLPVGVVKSKDSSRDGLSYILDVKLSTDFGNISNVKVIKNYMKEERINLEKSVKE